MDNFRKKLVLIFVLCLFASIYSINQDIIIFDVNIAIWVFSSSMAIAIASGIYVAGSLAADNEIKKLASKPTTEKQLKEREKWTGRIEITEEELIFTHDNNVSKEKIENISVLGEFTTEADPVTTDYYFIIVNNKSETIYVSAYAIGLEIVIKKLSKILNLEIEMSLASSIHFDSNILYPESLKNLKLFDFIETKPVGIAEKIKFKLGIGKPIIPTLTEEVKNYLKEAASNNM